MRELSVLASLLCVCACGSSNGAQPAASVPGAAAAEQPAGDGADPAGPATASLDLDDVQPYFREGGAAEAAARFRLEDWSAARAGFSAYLKEAGPDLEADARARVVLLLALCDAELGHWAEAAIGFEAALAELPLLADYIRYQAARAHYFAHDVGAALEHARAVSADSIVGADAELLVGDILRGRGEWGAVAAHYARYLEDRPSGIRLSEARYRLAQAHEELGKAIPEAITLYRRITISDPLSSWNDKAGARYAALLKKVPAGERDAYATLTADELIERGTRYYDGMRNPLSEADFAAALEAPGLTDASACVAAYHRADSAFKERERKRAAPLFDQAVTACEKAGDADLYVKAAYNGGRATAFTGRREEAMARYALIEEHHPEHSYADDARLRQAEEATRLNDQKTVTRLLSSIPEIYPEGDMRAEAMWRLAWRAIKADDCTEAMGWLDKQIATMPLDDNYWAEGQPQYWKGRCHAELGQKDESIASYQEAVRLYPLSYYALLALNRLREKHPTEFKALVAEIQTAPAGYDPDAPPFSFQPREEFATEGFARGVELMKLGIGWAAEAEFRRLGLTAPAGKDRVEDADLAEKIWAMAYFYHLAGRYEHSHWVTRWHVLDYKRHWPVGPWTVRWTIAYPPGFYDLLDRFAKKRGFPTELIQAIVREESAFDPIRESYANAIGLTQMIFSTATRFSRGTGIDPTRENLRDPEKNVTIGSNFLVFLWKKWDGMVALIPPSYNAGEGATGKWVKWRGDWPTDEWAEEIPYDQARRYSKRVIATYFTYAYLKDGTIPEMPNSIPRKLR